MSNYREPYEEYAEMFNRSLSDAGLEQFVDVKVLVNDKLKEIGKVRKAPKLVTYLNDYDAIIEYNEGVFEQLEDHQKEIMVEELVAQVHFNNDTGAIKITKPDIATFSGVLNKYGTEVYFRYANTVKEIFSQKEDKEKEMEGA